MSSTATLLHELRAHAPRCDPDRHLSLSSAIIRCESLGLVAVGGEKDLETQIGAFVDALHWHRATRTSAGPLRLLIGQGAHTGHVLEAFGTLLDALQGRVDVRIEVDGLAVTPSPPRWATMHRDWLADLRRRDAATAPDLVALLSAKVSAPSFRWYRPLSATAWSGRVDGLRVCEVKDGAHAGVLRVGAAGERGGDSAVRGQFRRILRSAGADGDELLFDHTSVDRAAVVIDTVAADRENGILSQHEREHRLEARLLREKMPMTIDGERLVPVVPLYPFQFPTLWSTHESASPRFLDVLMRCDAVPWAVEIKDPEVKDKRQQFRGAVTQAVLYRHFIRHSLPLHPWFEERGLDPAACEAAIAVEFLGRDADRDRKEIAWLADLFDVHIAALHERTNTSRPTAPCTVCHASTVGLVCESCLGSLRCASLCAEQLQFHQVLKGDDTTWLIDRWGRAYPVTDGLLIGRGNDALGLMIAERSVSGFHAELRRVDDHWEVHDLGSTNGTEVDGVAVEVATLAHGNRLNIGEVPLLFVDGVDMRRAPAKDPVPGQPATTAVVLPKRSIELVASTDPEAGGVLRCAGREAQLPALDFAFMSVLVARARSSGDSATAYVPTTDFATLPWNKPVFDPNQLRQLVSRLRNRLAGIGLGDLVQSKRGWGYRVELPTHDGDGVTQT